jgi:hypothetical protein
MFSIDDPKSVNPLNLPQIKFPSVLKSIGHLKKGFI